MAEARPSDSPDLQDILKEEDGDHCVKTAYGFKVTKRDGRVYKLKVQKTKQGNKVIKFLRKKFGKKSSDADAGPTAALHTVTYGNTEYLGLGSHYGVQLAPETFQIPNSGSQQHGTIEVGAQQQHRSTNTFIGTYENVYGDLNSRRLHYACSNITNRPLEVYHMSEANYDSSEEESEDEYEPMGSLSIVNGEGDVKDYDPVAFENTADDLSAAVAMHFERSRDLSEVEADRFERRGHLNTAEAERREHDTYPDDPYHNFTMACDWDNEKLDTNNQDTFQDDTEIMLHHESGFPPSDQEGTLSSSSNSTVLATTYIPNPRERKLLQLYDMIRTSDHVVLNERAVNTFATGEETEVDLTQSFANNSVLDQSEYDASISEDHPPRGSQHAFYITQQPATEFSFSTNYETQFPDTFSRSQPAEENSSAAHENESVSEFQLPTHSTSKREEQLHNLYTRIRSNETIPYDEMLVVDGQKYKSHEELLDAILESGDSVGTEDDAADDHAYYNVMHGYG